MALAPPAASAPPTRVATISQTDGQPSLGHDHGRQGGDQQQLDDPRLGERHVGADARIDAASGPGPATAESAMAARIPAPLGGNRRERATGNRPTPQPAAVEPRRSGARRRSRRPGRNMVGRCRPCVSARDVPPPLPDHPGHGGPQRGHRAPRSGSPTPDSAAPIGRRARSTTLTPTTAVPRRSSSSATEWWWALLVVACRAHGDRCLPAASRAGATSLAVLRPGPRGPRARPCWEPSSSTASSTPTSWWATSWWGWPLGGGDGPRPPSRSRRGTRRAGRVDRRPAGSPGCSSHCWPVRSWPGP